MSRFSATLGASLAGAVATAAAVALPGAVLAPAAHATAYVLQQVTANDLGPSRSWQRLQDDPANASRSAGVEEISPFADGARFNGSLHLAVAAHPGGPADASRSRSRRRSRPRSRTGSTARSR